jgi:hypothetical protein
LDRWILEDEQHEFIFDEAINFEPTLPLKS